MKLIKKILKITPFRLSFIIVCVAVAVAVVYDIRPKAFPVLSSLDIKSLDLKFKFRGFTPPKNKIIIAAGDDKTFQKYGQWPWDRATVFAPLLKKLCAYNTKAIGLDVVWSESEKVIPAGIRKAIEDKIAAGKTAELKEILFENSGDYVLRQAIEACGPKLVLGFAPSSDENQGLPQEEFKKRLKILTDKGQNILTSIIRGQAKFAAYNGDPEANVDYYHSAKTALLNLSELTPTTTAQGFFTNEADGDGNYRHSLMFYRTGEYFVPSLPLRMAQKTLTSLDSSANLKVYPFIPERNQGQELKLEINTTHGMQSIPIDLTGKTMVNYRGPNKTFPNISIADILAPEETVEFTVVDPSINDYKTQKIHKSELFDGASVLVGITALALYDIRPRPFDDQASGVENHATSLDNLLSNDFLVRPSAEIIIWLYLGVFISSLFYGWVVSRMGARWGAVTALSCVTGVLLFDQLYLFNKYNIVFSGVFQAIQLITQYVAITVLKYMQEEKDKIFIRSAFDKYVSPAIVDSMLKDPSRLKLGGDKKELSILFSDVRGFTELSEKVDVKVLTQFLNEYLGAMTDILQKNLGTLDKYIGDAVMGFWGAPVDVPEHHKLSVLTAVEMMKKLDDLNVQFKEKYGLTVDIGIGINSGAVSVGNFGSSKVFEYTVIGDNVNLASRLESINKYYGTNIIISETTYRGLASGEFLCREIDTVKVKGKIKPVKIYQVIPDTLKNAPLKQSLVMFNEALDCYYKRNWPIAIAKFKAVLNACGSDAVSTQMIERCEFYLQTPPKQEWDGSWEMKAK